MINLTWERFSGGFSSCSLANPATGYVNNPDSMGWSAVKTPLPRETYGWQTAKLRQGFDVLGVPKHLFQYGSVSALQTAQLSYRAAAT